MRLYFTSAETQEGQEVVEWSGTLADASSVRRRLREAGHWFVETDTIEVPTKKADLLAWLNANGSRPTLGE